MKSAPSLSFELRRSRIAFALTLAIGMLAVVALILSGLPQAWKIGAAVVLAVLSARSLRVQATAPVARCVLQPEGEWVISDGNVESKAALIRSHDLGFLIALHFRADSGRHIDLVLWPDSIPADARRQLRVWLGRHGGGKVG